MKFFLAIFFFLIFVNNSYSNEDFNGKWINESTNSVYEIVKNKKTYEVYLLYSGRFFQKYNNNIIGSFKRTPMGYKGNLIKPIQKYELKEFTTDSKFKIKNNKLIVTEKVKIYYDTFKFKSVLRRYNHKIKFKLGEKLFGVQIGQTIDNYKLGNMINIGDDKFSVWKHVVEAPEPNSEFGTYLIRYSNKSKKILEIDAYLKVNSSNLDFTKCKRVIQPYKNYINEKYGINYEIKETSYGSSLTLSKNNIDFYTLFVGCEKFDKNYYTAYISLSHNDLSMLDYLNKTSMPKNKKEF